MKVYLALLSSVLAIAAQAPTIFVIGDSHGMFCFTNKPHLVPAQLNPRYSFVYAYVEDGQRKELPFELVWLSGKTMHGVGKAGLGVLNFKKYPIQARDIVILLFGEIDCRAHICKQRDDHGRTITEILDTLVSHYSKTVLANLDQCPGCICVVCSVVPPRAGGYNQNPEMPMYGSAHDRIAITQQLNFRLEALCHKMGWLYLDLYSMYADDQGALDVRWADSTVHIASEHNGPIKTKLLTLLKAHHII